MHKLSVKIIAACVSALMILSLAGCCSSSGSNDSSSNNDKSSSSSSSQQATEKKFTNMKEYIASDEMKSQIDSITDTLKDSGLGFKTYADGDSIVFEYKFSKKVDGEKQAEYIKSTVDSQKSTFETVLNYLKERVNVKEPTLKLIYLNSDGKEIYSTEISSK